MFNPRDIHIILIGYDKPITQYRTNLEIIRQNWSFGQDIWITTIFNGNEDNFISGIGENSYICLKENRGAALGAMDEINAGLDFAVDHHRSIVAIYNFDVIFYTEDGFKKAITDFLNSGKMFSVAEDCNGLLSPDCMLFRREFLKDFLPIIPEHCKYREGLKINDVYINETELGWANTEEYIWYTLVKDIENDINIINYGATPEEKDNMIRDYLKDHYWHLMDRTSLPRLSWSESLQLGHEHKLKNVRDRLIRFNLTKGVVINDIIKNIPN
jgi:hypothetical protein